MNDEPNPEGGDSESKNCGSAPDIPKLRRRQKAYQRAEQAYKATQRLGKRLRQAASRLTTSEWITAIFTAVIAGATVWNVVVVRSSLGIMQGQLDEMREQRLVTIAQLRANMRRERPVMHPINREGTPAAVGDELAGWDVNPWWTNVGATNAINVTMFWEIFIIPRPKITGGVLHLPDCPHPRRPADNIVPTITQPNGTPTQVSQRLKVEDAVRAQKDGDNAEMIFFAGHLEYKDVFPGSAIHHDDWCVIVIPYDLRNSNFSFLGMRDEAD